MARRTLNNSRVVNAARMAMSKGIIKPENINDYVRRLLRNELVRLDAAIARAGLPVPPVIAKALAS